MGTPKGGAVAAAKKPTSRRAPRARSSAPRAGKLLVTGVMHAWVNCVDGVVRQYDEGAEIPSDGVSPEEVERLAALNVFGISPVVIAQEETDRLVAAGLASRSVEPERAPEEQPGGSADPDGLESDPEAKSLGGTFPSSG